jgi:hypothetical protein
VPHRDHLLGAGQRGTAITKKHRAREGRLVGQAARGAQSFTASPSRYRKKNQEIA